MVELSATAATTTLHPHGGLLQASGHCAVSCSVTSEQSRPHPPFGSAYVWNLLRLSAFTLAEPRKQHKPLGRDSRRARLLRRLHYSHPRASRSDSNTGNPYEREGDDGDAYANREALDHKPKSIEPIA
jgi:hypothetical protein